VVAAVLAVVLAAVLVGVATAYVSRGHGRGQLASQREFSAGRVDSLAAEIAERGPFLVADASPSRQRDIYVLHTGGSDVDAGWVVVSAFAPGQTNRTCFLRWDPEADGFQDPCTEETYVADGADLHHYPTEVREGRLYVDLNR
jgi:hypothetical protein